MACQGNEDEEICILIYIHHQGQLTYIKASMLCLAVYITGCEALLASSLLLCDAFLATPFFLVYISLRKST